MRSTLFSRQDLDKKSFQLKPGNFFVTHGSDFFDKLIQIFTQAKWNHAGLITDHDGTIIELTSQGIKKHSITKYNLQDIYIVNVEMSEEDRQQVKDFSEVMLKKHEHYGFLTIASIAFKIITKSRLIVK